jgi:hypothetical protein
MQKATPPPEPRNTAFAFIFTIVLLDVIALGIVIPVLPKLVESMLGGDTPRAAEIYGPCWAPCPTASAAVRCCSSPCLALASTTS